MPDLEYSQSDIQAAGCHTAVEAGVQYGRNGSLSRQKSLQGTRHKAQNDRAADTHVCHTSEADHIVEYRYVLAQPLRSMYQDSSSFSLRLFWQWLSSRQHSSASHASGVHS